MFRTTVTSLTGAEMRSLFSTADMSFPDIIFTFSYTGSDQSLLIPDGYNFAEYYMIGAAGGRGSTNAQASLFPGGAGGATTGTLSVTPSSTLTIIVGQGGRSSVAAKPGTYGNGGGTGSSPGFLSGEGGGRSAIQIVAGTDAATAGGGGGTCGSKTGAVGGGTNGGSATGTGAGAGGTQSTGGTGATGGAQGNGTDGSARQGGAGGGYGGGGGGGFFGGGGGCNTDGSGGAGGGGSGLAGGTSATTTAGTGVNPPLTGDSRYPGGNVGVANSTSDQAGHGYIWVRLFP